MAQPDNGTALVFCVTTASMLFIAGINHKYIIAGIVGIAAFLPVFFLVILPKMPIYIQNRFMVFLHPSKDPMGAGYNALIAKISVGSGGLLGHGMFGDYKAQLDLLPVKESDFIFSVIGEEMGFVFCSLIIIVFVVLLMRFLHYSRTAKDSYGALIIVGVTAMMAFHMLQNIGMNIGLLPVAGIPLPFISYGGSALLTNMVGVGFVLNAGTPGKRRSFNPYRRKTGETETISNVALKDLKT